VPTEVLGSLPEASAALVRAVLEQADANAVCVHLVGGPVRDLLLGRAVRDVDLLVEAWDGGGALDLARALATSELQTSAHDRFGTVTLRAEKAAIDLATVRRETYAHDGALPAVEPGSLEEDLRRRDFTVNALALPLSAAARARYAGIIDVEEGLADLEQRRLRIVHPRSFHDDPTRALRAARLAPRLGFSVTRDTRSALRNALRDGAFGRVSGDRLRREFVKLFEDAVLGLDPARALRLLSDWHVLGALEPGLGVERAAAAPLRRIGRAVVEAPWQAGRWRPWVSGLAVWLATLPPALRRRTLRRFAVRGEQARRIADFPKARDAWLRGLARARGRGAIDAVLAGVDEESLHALHAWAPPALRRRIGRWAGQDRARRLPLTGSDLVEIGLSGPAVGRALLRIRTAYLDGALRTREEALALARELSRGRGACRPSRPKKQPRR
jgi:tRNA nucleotidyltransferase (CCA-adding enzyme)